MRRSPTSHGGTRLRPHNCGALKGRSRKRYALNHRGVALHIGLIDHLVNEAQIADEFEGLIGNYLQTNTEGCRLSKQLVTECFDLDFDHFRDRYMELQRKAMGSSDFHEAMAAYREQRKPRWNDSH